jgi:hypothetical protein
MSSSKSDIPRKTLLTKSLNTSTNPYFDSPPHNPNRTSDLFAVKSKKSNIFSPKKNILPRNLTPNFTQNPSKLLQLGDGLAIEDPGKAGSLGEVQSMRSLSAGG